MFGMALRRRQYRVVLFLWSSPVPACGTVAGVIPAGCEVRRSGPAAREPASDHHWKTLDGGDHHVRPNTWLLRPPCNVMILLANPEPSTHGPSQHFAPPHDFGRKRGIAEVDWQPSIAEGDARDPLLTSLAAAFSTAFERLSASNVFALMPDPSFFTFARYRCYRLLAVLMTR